MTKPRRMGRANDDRDPDRYQMKDIKRRLASLEGKLDRHHKRILDLQAKLLSFLSEVDESNSPPQTDNDNQDNKWS